MKKTRLGLLRAAAATREDVIALPSDELAGTVHLAGEILHVANAELQRRHSEQQSATRQEWELRRKRMKAEAEAAEKAQRQADAEELAALAKRQAKRDEEEGERARDAIRAAGLKAVPAFSHPR